MKFSISKFFLLFIFTISFFYCKAVPQKRENKPVEKIQTKVSFDASNQALVEAF